MQLQEIKGKSKKTGKEYTAYTIKIGEYQTPLFFPSKIELMYIKNIIKKDLYNDFKGDYLDVDTGTDE